MHLLLAALPVLLAFGLAEQASVDEDYARMLLEKPDLLPFRLNDGQGYIDSGDCMHLILNPNLPYCTDEVAQPDKKDEKKPETNKAVNMVELWFGPRLGKKALPKTESKLNELECIKIPPYCTLGLSQLTYKNVDKKLQSDQVPNTAGVWIGPHPGKTYFPDGAFGVKSIDCMPSTLDPNVLHCSDEISEPKVRKYEKNSEFDDPTKIFGTLLEEQIGVPYQIHGDDVSFEDIPYMVHTMFPNLPYSTDEAYKIRDKKFIKKTHSDNVANLAELWFGPRLGKKSYTQSEMHLHELHCMPSTLYPYLLNCTDEVAQARERKVEKNPQSNKAANLVGLWFGPRLGKKSDPQSEMNIQNDMDTQSRNPIMEYLLSRYTRAPGRPRRPITGLIPIGRPGRSAAKRDDGDSEEMQPGKSPYEGLKRHVTGLIPAGRAGRSEGNGPKRNGASPGGGMWFGPRLGKRTSQLVQPISVQDRRRVPITGLIPFERSGRSWLAQAVRRRLVPITGMYPHARVGRSEENSVRRRLVPITGMYPHARVGRSEENSVRRRLVPITGMYPRPRVGRSEENSARRRIDMPLRFGRVARDNVGRGFMPMHFGQPAEDDDEAQYEDTIADFNNY